MRRYDASKVEVSREWRDQNVNVLPGVINLMPTKLGERWERVTERDKELVLTQNEWPARIRTTGGEDGRICEAWGRRADTSAHVSNRSNPV